LNFLKHIGNEMPSTSAKQHKFMEAVAHNPEFAKKAGVSQSVGKEFSAADKAQKARPDLQVINKQKTDHGSMNLFKKGGVMKESKAEDRKEMAEDKKQDVKLIKKAFKEHDTQEHKGGKGTKLTLKKGGMAMKETMGPRTMAKDVEAGSNKLTKFGQSAVQKRGMTKGTNLGDSGPSMGIMGGGMKKGGGVKKMAAGGSASSRADGIASRGKTKGRMV
jgi:hypothetical protein